MLWLDQIQEAIQAANQDEEEALVCTYTVTCPTPVPFFLNPKTFPTLRYLKRPRTVRLLFPLPLISGVPFSPTVTLNPSCLAVASAVAEINRTVDQGVPEDTLQALQAPGAALRGVLPECADAYQTELAQAQTDPADTGNYGGQDHLLVWVICSDP